jgi:adenylate cyclase
LSKEVETERRLAAVLAADVAGYSRLVDADETGTLRALTTQRAVLDAAIARHRGRIANTAGDSVLAEFPSVVNAVQCAVEAQHALRAAAEEEAEDQRVLFRMGIHIGDVVVRGGDLLGGGVNVAARLEALADPGGIVISAAAHEQVRKILPLAFTDLGAQSVKNIGEPLRAFAIGSVPTFVTAQVLGGDGTPLPLPDKPSIAVLPFQNMSGDPEQEYFSDGVTEDIITNLARFREFDVIERNSTFGYKGAVIDLAKISRELKVDYVVQGTIRSTSDRIRITAQLVKVANNTNVWVERYDRELVDVFSLQDEITARITTAVNPAIRSSESLAAMRKRPSDLAAWDHVWRGLWQINQFRREANLQGRTEFQAAIAQDARCAQAHAWLGMTHVFDAWFNWTEIHAASLSSAHQSAAEALRCDDTEPMSHVANAVQCFWSGRLEQARESSERALALNPNSFLANFVVGGSLNYLGQCETAIGFHLKALDLSPTDPFAWNCLGSLAHTYLNLERYEDAIASADRAIVRRHGYLFGRVIRAAALAYAGRSREASEAIEAIREIAPDFSAARLDHYPFVREAQKRRLLAGLTLAGLESGPTEAPERPTTSHPTLPPPDKPSIAVLPFQNMSGDPEQDYFADGVVEEIITELSRHKSLFVIARNSSFTYKGKLVDIKQVGRELGVRYVLEGSVRKAGGRVRITAQLIDSITGAHVWADRFDRELSDIFALQDDVTRSVVTAVEPSVRSAEVARKNSVPTQDLSAYDLCLRARASLGAVPPDSMQAEPLLRRAVALDPTYSDAWAMLADALAMPIARGLRTDHEAKKELIETALMATKVGPDNGLALAMAGGYLAMWGGPHELDRGVDLAKRALALHPNSDEVRGFAGWALMFSGELDAALEHLEIGLRLSPIGPRVPRITLGMMRVLFLQRNFSEVITLADKMRTRLSESPPYWRYRAAALAHAGRLDEARDALARLLTLIPAESISTVPADGYRHQWMRDLLFDGLRKAGMSE